MTDINLDMNEREEVYAYLDNLRMTGTTNMCGAGSYLSAEFGFDKHYARAWLTHWMQHHGN